MNKKNKITCDMCGLEFFSHTITYHQGKAFCYMCDFHYLIEKLAEEKSVLIPGYFINREHYKNYEYLMTKIYSYTAEPLDYRLAAYINGLPTIFELYPKHYPIFRDFPFLWAFNWRVFYLTYDDNEITHISLKEKVEPAQLNELVKCLSTDYQTILDCGYNIFHKNSPLQEKDIESFKNLYRTKLSQINIPIIEEIFRISTM